MNQTKQDPNPFRFAKEELIRLHGLYPESRYGLCGRVIDHPGRTEAAAIIKRVLEKHVWLEDWIVSNKHGKRTTVKTNHKKMFQTRLNWCDWLAEQWDNGVRK